MTFDALPVEQGFVPAVSIYGHNGTTVLEWKATYALDTMTAALLAAAGYGERALVVLRASTGIAR